MFAISVATSSIIVRVSTLSNKKKGTLPRGMSYNFSEAAMRDGEGVSKIATKGRYKIQEDLEDDPLKFTKNYYKNF